MSSARIFLTGGDNFGWALDEDFALTRRALNGIVEFTDLRQSQVIHSVWWKNLADLPKGLLKGKRLICHVPGEPYRYLSIPQHRTMIGLVGCWIAQTRQAANQLSALGLTNVLIPYTVDPAIFHSISRSDPKLEAIRAQWNIPRDRYLIGNFHRDTEGGDLREPKLVKGPDIFAEIVFALWKADFPIHVVLAGPRRHWIRNRLSDLGIPFTYIGRIGDEDDIKLNLLPRDTLNLLYNIIDLYVISSRSEGGPRSILESAAAQCKVISTSVGLAHDVLDSTCIFMSCDHAVNIVRQDIAKGRLSRVLNLHHDRVLRNHCLDAAIPLFRKLYSSFEVLPVYDDRSVANHPRNASNKWGVPQLLGRVFRKGNNTFSVGLWHKFFAPPYGGGNQFMLALRNALRRLGIVVRENELHKDINAYILNSIHFDVDRFTDFSRRHQLNVVHRIDGPIYLIRGFDREKDELCFRLNAQFASATVLQSAWTYQRIVEMGYQPVNPVIIHNAVDSDIFHQHGRVPFDSGRKIRLISTSWSDNPNKGGPVYRWIEEHIDWNRYDYTFVGRASERFSHICHIPPVPSDQLADILRQHDIYITASKRDPCSNALIEALSCGLPALYLNDGGHPELVRYGGLSFDSVDEIIPQLERIVEEYEVFQRLIVVPSIAQVTEKYLELAKGVEN